MRLYFGGGLNEQQTPHIYECGVGYNFELGIRQSKLVPRKPIDLMGTATNASAVRGIMQLVKRDNSETTLVQVGDTVYLWDGSSTFTSKATVNANSKLRDVYWSLGDYLVVVDISKATVIKKWDGTTFSTLTTGLGTDLYAKYGLVFQNRVWLFNVKTTTDTPHLMVASAFENPTSYDTSLRGGPSETGGGSFSVGTEAFYMLSPDLKPINGATVVNGELIISTELGRVFKLSGTNAETYQWIEYYPGSASLGDEAMENIGNDVIYMKAGGGVDLISATQTSGDVAADDLSRWIPETVRDITGAITIYDQKNQKVLFFVANKVLVLFKDLIGGEMSPWSVYKTQETFAFNTLAAKYMRVPGSSAYSVFFGDDAGRMFDLNGSGDGDAGSSDIMVSRKTRYIYSGEGGNQRGEGALDLMRRIIRGVIQYRRVLDPCNVTLTFDWGDEYNESQSVITLKGSPTLASGAYFGGSGMYYGGDDFYSQGFEFANKISSQTFSPSGKGPGFFLTVSLETDTSFQIDSLDLN